MWKELFSSHYIFIEQETIFVVIQIYNYWFDAPSIEDKLILVGYSLFSLSVVYSVFLYVSIGWMAKIMLAILGEKISSSWKHNNKDRDYWGRQLTIWKVEYYSISELVYYINGCFGPLLLVALACCFVRVINNLFTALNLIGISSTKFTGFSCVFWFYLAENFYFFSSITYTSYVIRETVKPRQSFFF